jgi:hypothetical protein
MNPDPDHDGNEPREFWDGVPGEDQEEIAAERRKAASADPMRTGISRTIGGHAAALTKSAFAGRGLDAAELVQRWPELVGDVLARCTAPEHLVFPRKQRTGGELRVRCASAAMVTALAGEVTRLAARINAGLGGPVVGKISFKQGPLPARQASDLTSSPSASPERVAAIAAITSYGDDDEVRAALASLGLVIRSDS